jgi:hypothetical protein
MKDITFFDAFRIDHWHGMRLTLLKIGEKMGELFES